MEAQGGEEADDTGRYSLRYHCEIMVFSDFMTRQSVEPPIDSLQFTPFNEAAEIAAR